MHHTVFDCRDPQLEAEFWAAVLGQPVTYRSPDFVVVSRDATTSGLAFALAPAHVPPDWPAPHNGQQLHLDVMADDVQAAAAAVVALGAVQLAGDVFADPAGHPFCLIARPAWAAPIT